MIINTIKDLKNAIKNLPDEAPIFPAVLTDDENFPCDDINTIDFQITSYGFAIIFDAH